MIKKEKIFLVIILILSLFLLYNLIKPLIINESEIFCRDCNVILISIDALRADHLSIYGYNRNTSPKIDKFANENILFLNAFSQATWTPFSHQSIFTSLYPSMLYNFSTQNLSSTDKTILTLPEIMKQYDYKTIAYVNAPYLSSFYGFNKGFDLFYEDGIFDGNLGDIKSINERIFDQLQKIDGKKFFLFIHYMDVHCPYVPPEPYFSMYDSSYNGNLNLTGKCGHGYFNQINLSETDVQHIIAAYDGGIRYTDEHIAELFNKLEKLQLINNTIIILTADHGEELKDHGLIGHGHSLYDEMIHIPLLIKIPHIRNKIVNEQVRSLDIYPTILDLLEIPIPDYIEGKSLVPLILNKEKSNETIFSETIYHISMRTPEFKFIYNRITKDEELYDLKDDPKEQLNVIDKYPEIRRIFEKKLFEWQELVKNKSKFIYN